MSEVWRPILGFPYEVSSEGRVRRAAPGHGSHGNNTYTGRVLKGYVDRDGYRIVLLSREAIPHYRKVHRLVCAAFNGPAPFIRAEVRHLDGVRANNVPTNLAWGTAKDNADDRARHGNTRRGERSPRAKLSQADVDNIRARHRALGIGRQRVPRGTMPHLAEQYGVTVHCVATIVGGRGFSTGGSK